MKTVCRKCRKACQVVEHESTDWVECGDRLVEMRLLHPQSACCGADYTEVLEGFLCTDCGDWGPVQWGLIDGQRVAVSACCKAPAARRGSQGPTPDEALRAGRVA